MSRNRRETNDRAGQRTLLGKFISLGGQRSRVEISDDEDDEVEEISTVSVKIGLGKRICNLKKLTTSSP